MQVRKRSVRLLEVSVTFDCPLFVRRLAASYALKLCMSRFDLVHADE